MRRNAFLPMLAAALSAAACLGGAVPNARLWGDGDRVVFFGDSITHGGAYPEYISLYYVTRFPGKDIWFSNSGWSGASAPQGIASIDEDVAAKKPTVVTVAILEAMWVWNDYLLPYLVLDINKYKTIPIAVQFLKQSHGTIDWGAMMAILVLAIIPIVILYIFAQKYIIEGVLAGAVKG